MGALNNIYKYVCKVELYLAIFALLSSVTVIFIASAMRSMGNPIRWGLDISLLLFTWSTFLGADIAFRNNKTVYVDIVVNNIPEVARKALRLLCYLIVLVFMCAMVYYGILLSYRSWPRSFQGIPNLSFSWVTMSVPFSFSLMIITTLRKIYYEYFKGIPDPMIEQEQEGGEF